MPKDDRVRLRHMLDAASEAVEFAKGKTRADLERDRLLVLGLLKCIEIVGEAAARVSPDVQSRYPRIPWLDIVGMRNRLVHVYFDLTSTGCGTRWNRTCRRSSPRSTKS